MRFRLPLLTAPLCALALACSGSEGDSAGEHEGHDHDHHGDHGEGETVTMAATDGGTWEVMMTLPDAGVQTSEEFDLTFMVHNASDDSMVMDADLAVTAWMPDHGHGMNQEPVVASNGDGSFTADGMLFHMTGYWEVIADVTVGGSTESATLSIACCD